MYDFCSNPKFRHSPMKRLGCSILRSHCKQGNKEACKNLRAAKKNRKSNRTKNIVRRSSGERRRAKQRR
jgi:hypothetical protein